LTVPGEEALANSVPAAAVIRRGQALFGFIGRKESVGGMVSRMLKTHGSPGGMRPILPYLSEGEGSGIPGVAVKCVDIRRNICGEGGFLALN
jgi:hypothetical protein